MPAAARLTAAPNAHQVHDIPAQSRSAAIRPATYREADNSLEVVWSTGARRRMYDWASDSVVEEELDMSAEAVNLQRFNAGTLQVVDGHDVYSGVSAILGIALDGRIEAGQGISRIALSTDPAKSGPVGDIRAGIIRAMSFGYSVQRYVRTRAIERTDGGNCDLLRAVEWTPNELTFCAVGADPNAAPRSAYAAEHQQRRSTSPQALSPCEYVEQPSAARAAIQPQEQSMPQPSVQETDPAPGGATHSQRSPQPGADDAVAAARQAELQRSADITDLCQRHAVPQLAATLIRSGATLDSARTNVLEELARRDAAAGGHRNVRIETTRDEMQTRLAGVEEALMARVDSRSPLTDNGRQYRGLTLLEMGRELLDWHGVATRTSGMDKMTLATRIMSFRSGAGFMGTSDFSSLLANVARKRLRMGYDENPGTYTRWARRAPNAPDFKSLSVVQMSAMPDLLQVNEAGEFKYGALSDGAESYKLITYGRIVALSRQAVINDDLRAFDRLVSGFGASSARLENRLVYAQLTGNAAMSDTGALFNATAVTTAGGHANLATGGGSALQFSALTTARAAMRVQKGLQGEELNLAPAYLIVPAALEQSAYQYTSSQYVPAKQTDVNEFRAGGRTALDPIVEPILDANSATAWYLAAQNSQVDTVEYCYLDGAEGPVIESEIGFEVDGLSFKCREDFAAKVIDWRGLYKSAGA